MKHRLEMRKVPLPNGETIFIRVRPGGPESIVLLHGNLAGSLHFEPIMEAFEDKYTVYAPDLRGYGHSTYHRQIDSLGDFSMDIAAVCDALGIKNAVFAGWSTGGGVGLELAADRLDLVRKLILIAGISYRGFPVPRKDACGKPIPGTFYTSREELAKDPKQVVMLREAVENRNEAVLRRVYDKGIYVVNRPPEAAYAAYIEEMYLQRNMEDAYWALATFNLSNRWNGISEGSGKIGKIAIPVLTLHGDSDYIVERTAVLETAEALGALAQFVELEHCGHSPMVDCPDALVSYIKQFIAE